MDEGKIHGRAGLNLLFEDKSNLCQDFKVVSDFLETIRLDKECTKLDLSGYSQEKIM